MPVIVYMSHCLVTFVPLYRSFLTYILSVTDHTKYNSCVWSCVRFLLYLFAPKEPSFHLHDHVCLYAYIGSKNIQPSHWPKEDMFLSTVPYTMQMGQLPCDKQTYWSFPSSQRECKLMIHISTNEEVCLILIWSCCCIRSNSASGLGKDVQWRKTFWQKKH